ncbi:hypothetical protein ABS642_01965 [Microbacterium sp. A8/3-1]|uniref:PKD domain-containing protein n=1 Tax=Microbacterium sp. A8/3-1 TaxID=3160749 RepID=A0AAU7VWL5_9MICO
MTNSCTLTQQTTTGCPTNLGDRIRFDDTRTIPGTDGGTSPIYDDDPGPRYTPKPFDFNSCVIDWDSYNRCFRARQDAEVVEEEPTIPAITITDLAQFAPDPVATTGEPDNLGVAGMPTNFVAAASAHTRTGALFGIPLTVRFTPVGYDFRYGDGDAASTTTGGQPWAALGQASFTPTATSHIYAERGTYDAGVTVRYTAEVDLGIGWFPVAGQLSIAGPTQQIRIFEAHTALVARTCAEQPAAPGC